MKTNKLLVCLLLILVSINAKAQDPSVSVYIDSASYNSSKEFEFNVMMVASGSTTSFQLRAFQTGLYLDPAWVNGGTITAQNVSAYSELEGLGYNGTFQWNSTDKLINCSVNFDVLGPTSCIFTEVTDVPIIVARIRLTNDVDYPCSPPNIKFNYVSNISPLRLRTSFSWREIACSVNYDMFYPGRTYSGTANFNTENYSIVDVDGKSEVTTAVEGNPGFCSSQLALKLYIDGYYNAGGILNAALLNTGTYRANAEQADTITVELRSDADYNIVVNSFKTILSSTGVAYVLMPIGYVGQSFWLVIKHRNLVTTWSAAPVTISSPTSSYDFTTSPAQAYGGNEIETYDHNGYSIYNGDIDDGTLTGTQDDFIDGVDYVLLDQDIQQGLSGYVISDINGDGFVDGIDYVILDQNIQIGVSSNHP